MARTMWRWVTCAISCARTDANSLSDRVADIIPELTPTKPPGAANAFSDVSSTTKNVNPRSRRSDDATSRYPSDWMYCSTRGSSTRVSLDRISRMNASPSTRSSAGESASSDASPKSGSLTCAPDSPAGPIAPPATASITRSARNARKQWRPSPAAHRFPWGCG